MSTPSDDEQAILDGIRESLEVNKVEGYIVDRWKAGITIWFTDGPILPERKGKLSSITLEPTGGTLLVRARTNAYWSDDRIFEYADPEMFSQLQQFLGQFGVVFK